MRFDRERWIIPLSGGVDSRGLLLALDQQDAPKFRTVTWGTTDALTLKRNDVDIATRVARQLSMSHQILPLELNGESRVTLMRRFLAAGEGRVATLSGYADGFSIWKQFYENKLDGIVRGDEAFGTVRPATAFEARRAAQLTLLTDYFSADVAGRLDLPEQKLPAALERRPDESLSTWADRLYQQFRLPRLCAALTDLKLPYIEVANPLLSAELIAFTRQLPDSLRADKRLWRNWVTSKLPGVPYAVHPAIPQMQDILTDTGMLKSMLDSLEQECLLLSPSLRLYLCARIKTELRKTPDDRQRQRVQRRFQFLPRRARSLLRPAIRRNRQLNPLLLAFRAFIIQQMMSRLREDSASMLPRLQRTADF
jgi:hypothetical protein